ncbi:diguanylate cyclase [Thiospirochaeta perfilievii]|uniref:diguanylate cyclase n=1 Tax=Thiospirochaeta perfilievii TaxID=252967 RepID=A0A5C1QBZ6_9SPIO|nr:diguanylate cyclase [Thiospirochaeta perfilievii]QEN04409.1 diguanylate cyclase [Thiospirochaeta perfilievii]
MNSQVLGLIESSKKLFISDIDAAEKSALKAVKLSRSLNLKLELAESLTVLARVLADKGCIDQVTNTLFEAHELLEESRDKSPLIQVYSTLGSFYLGTGELELSLESYMSSLNLSIELNEKIKKPNTLMGIGTVLAYKGSNSDALEYYQDAKEAAEENGNVEVVLKSLNNIGWVYNSLDMLEEAEGYLNLCIKKAKNEGLRNILMPALDELGIIYRKKKLYNKAIECWKEAIKIDQERGVSYNSTAPNINLADYYISVENWSEARSYLDAAHVMCNRTRSRIDLIEIYRLESKISESQGNFFEALNNYKKYTELDREIRTQESIRELNRVKVDTLTKGRDRLVILGKIGREITESLDLSTMLSRIKTNAAKLFDFSIIGIAKYDSKTGDISYELFLEDGNILPNVYTNRSDTNSVAAWVVRNEKPVIISNYKEEYHKYVETENILSSAHWKINNKTPQSVLYNPLKIEDKIIGLITVQSYKVAAYPVEAVEAFNILSSYAAIGLNNALQSNKITEQNRRLSILATSDSLTGIKNRRAFFESIEKSRAWSLRNKIPFSLILLDLDYFKKINDSYGHPAGDFCLIEVSKVLKESIYRANDDVGRIGGEEFGVLLNNTDSNGALIVANRIRESIAALDLKFKGINFSITSSLGVITVYPEDDKLLSVKQIVSNVDKALYVAKNSGRNRVEEYK